MMRRSMTTLLTAEELAERLSVSPRTVREWGRSGHIPRIRVSPKVVRFDFEEIVEGLKDRKEKNSGKAI